MSRWSAVPGTIYLLHFDRPYRHARHYLGWSAALDRRLAAHSAGHGARIMAVVREAGIDHRLVRTWRGSRYDERRLKQRHGAVALCPECTPGAGSGRWPILAVGPHRARPRAGRCRDCRGRITYVARVATPHWRHVPAPKLARVA